MEMCGQRHAPATFPPIKNTDTHRIGGGIGSIVGLGPLEKRKFISPIRIRIPDRPACSEMQYRLRYS